ncbi:GNAT family N-acetyltransferase [Maribacter aurantiacus]|uniref:N-acetyltransferase family protein n=1 Tax=Maribacter aurantiacus TaxID=1882343 RepID=A0A5R8M6V8_9FLAO|nr:GNAT family N-acetyltransferase [Maribacter aurantiacus]TLF45318.1 N-acetyltransferase family protein [Maribacter aurantiacus]
MISIRPMAATDWEKVAKIYGEGIATGMATFETQITTYEKWDRSHLKICRFVGLYENNLAGWAALAPVSSRHVYRGVAEVSIYIGEKYRGLGLGKALLKHLILESEAQGFWTLQSGIFPLNQTSIKLHESVGFRKIGVRERVGNLNGVWIDNVLFERRSTVIGID